MLFVQPRISNRALMKERDALMLRTVMHVSSANEYYQMAPRYELDHAEAKELLNKARISANLVNIKAIALNCLTGKVNPRSKLEQKIVEAIDYDVYNMSKAIDKVQSVRDFDPNFEFEIEAEAVKAIQPRLEGFLWRKVKFLCVNGVSHADWLQEASEIAALAVRWSWPFRQDELYSGVAWTSARNWVINQIYHRTIPAQNPYVRDEHGNSIYRWHGITGKEDWAVEDDPTLNIAYNQIIRQLKPNEREAVWLIGMDSRANFEGLLSLIQKVHPEIMDCFEASEHPWYRQAVAAFCKMSVLELNSLLKLVGSKLTGSLESI